MQGGDAEIGQGHMLLLSKIKNYRRIGNSKVEKLVMTVKNLDNIS